VRARIAAAAAGALLIATVIVAFGLSSNPIVAGNSSVEPIRPSVFVNPGTPECQAVSRVPRGADRIKLLITYLEGGAQDLRVEISDSRVPVTAGKLQPASPGERLIELHPRTRAAHRATLCFFNPGRGKVVIGGDLKRISGAAKGPQAEKQGTASVVFLRPGSSSWFAQTGTIADRYANSQSGITGGGSLWVAVLFAIAAGLIGLWSVVRLPGRST
jgi:hypothetical protein